MMKFSKIILFSLLLFVIVGINAVSAIDDVNSTVGENTLTIHSDSNYDLDATDEEINYDDKILKEDAPIIINKDTFTNYFDDEGRILDSVPEGATLDFQGQIMSSDSIKAIYINKSVKLLSTTNDASITLNTVNGALANGNIANRFIIDNVSSVIVQNIVFNRTQIIIHDSSNVILNNVKIISDDYSIVNKNNSPDRFETPLVKFENIGSITLKNSHVQVYNLGSRLIGCFDVKNAVFDNNSFIVRAVSLAIDKRVENVIWFSKNIGNNVDMSLRISDSSVNFTNNYFDVNYTDFSNSYILANNILFENNTFTQLNTNYISSAIGFQFRGGSKSNIIVKDNKIPFMEVIGNGIICNNYVNYRLSSIGSFLIHDNVIGCHIGSRTFNDVSISSNSIFYNNLINGEIGFAKNAKNITVKNNVIDGIGDGKSTNSFAINVKSTETYIINNTISGIVTIEKDGNCEIYDNVINGTININSKSSVIKNNIISAFDSNYAVSIVGGNEYINNEISNNEIYSKWYCGDNAINYDENYLNFIEYNTPKTQIGMFVNTPIDIFDYGENTTIVVNMPNVNGNVTIDVDGQKYVVDLVNGNASHVLTKYSVGLNNITVIYYDDVNDVWAIGYANFTVNKVTFCPVELIYGEMVEGTLSSVNFILPDDADGTILVSLTNGVFTVNIEQDANASINVISLPGLFEGDYDISATFESDKYVTNSSNDIIRYVHIPVYELIVNDIVMDYKDGSKYKVLVTKDGIAVGAGEVVKVTFNGKTVNVKTDGEGYATLKLDAAPKTYTIKASYKGVTKSSKVTIKNVLKASNISKKKAKTIKFSATLKNSKGKPITGKKITFKLKGKTYTAKTNKKGVATISIKNLKVGKHTITSKYELCTVKNTITIKK